MGGLGLWVVCLVCFCGFCGIVLMVLGCFGAGLLGGFGVFRGLWWVAGFRWVGSTCAAVFVGFGLEGCYVVLLVSG